MGEILKKLREHLGMNQKQLAVALGLSQGAISQYESGTSEPGIQTAKLVIALAREHGVDLTLDQLYGIDKAA